MAVALDDLVPGTDYAFVFTVVDGALAPARVWASAGYVGVWHFATQNDDGSYPDASGHSTADWVQANYDTQVLGTDFLTYGDPERTARATLLLVY